MIQYGIQGGGFGLLDIELGRSSCIFSWLICIDLLGLGACLSFPGCDFAFSLFVCMLGGIFLRSVDDISWLFM